MRVLDKQINSKHDEQWMDIHCFNRHTLASSWSFHFFIVEFFCCLWICLTLSVIYKYFWVYCIDNVSTYPYLIHYIHLNTILQRNDFGFICEISGIHGIFSSNALFVKIIFYNLICVFPFFSNPWFFFSFSSSSPFPPLLWPSLRDLAQC